MEENKKVVLVGVNLNDDANFDYHMLELENLAIACNFEVVDRIIQNSDRIQHSYYLGKGKLEELADIIKEKNIDIAVFSDELSPAQIKNIERYLKCMIMDRTNLILDIFASRAQTKEAKMQVEIAQLQYMLPHLVGSYERLGRQSGGGAAGLANKGTGETKLELDRRKMLQKISFLKKELQKIVIKREVQRSLRKRNEIPVVSLVGYTNSGKSTIMNTLIDMYTDNDEKKVFEEDMLFATLETSVREIRLNGNKLFLLTDTVGFIDKLPHKLIKAFRSTLEEIKEADIIIHVVDYSNPEFEKQIEVTNSTLEDIGVYVKHNSSVRTKDATAEKKDIPIVYVYNKCDLKGMTTYKIEGNKLYMSAKKKIGIKELIELIRKEISKDYIHCKMLIPFNKGNVSSYLVEKYKIILNEYTEEGNLLELQCSRGDYEKYKEFVVKE